MTAPPGTARLSVQRLNFRYPRQRELALVDVTFDVDEGDILGVLGPNGSGKTTLLAALLDARHGARGGEVLISGERGGRSAVGYAPQEIALYRQLTVVENMRHAARLRVPWARVGEAVDSALEEYGIARVANLQVHRLSGGWQRIVHVAASFVHRPPIRLLDEPTAALDFEARIRLLGLVRAWRDQQVTTLLTSHYPEDIEQVCSSVVLLDGGRVVRKLRLDELLGRDRPTLLVESEADGDRRQSTAPAPRLVRDLPDTLAALVRSDGGAPTASLTNVRIVQNTLRDLLSRDSDHDHDHDREGSLDGVG